MEKKIFSEPTDDLNLSKGKLISLCNQVFENSEKFDEELIINCVLACSMREVDFDLSQKLCEKFLLSGNYDLQRIALLSISHIARTYKRNINSNIYEILLEIYKNKKNELWGEADEVFDDLEIFLNYKKPQI